MKRYNTICYFEWPIFLYLLKMPCLIFDSDIPQAEIVLRGIVFSRGKEFGESKTGQHGYNKCGEKNVHFFKVNAEFVEVMHHKFKKRDA